MTQEEILEGNKLIAEFDGVVWKDASLVNYPRPNKQWSIKFPNGKQFSEYGNIDDILSKYCKYHSSWDWLMPVVEKIIYNYDESKSLDIMRELSYAKIESVYQSVIEFIKWYNQNK